LRQIEEEFIKRGLVRFGYQHIIILGPESQLAAEASECAAEQDAFWVYHDRLFDAQKGRTMGAYSKDNLKRYAAELELDSQSFNECLDSGRHTEAVRQESQAASRLGVRSTPTFAINGRALLGAQAFDVFKAFIEDELARAGN
jgi:protein-disulfide isomerase